MRITIVMLAALSATGAAHAASPVSGVVDSVTLDCASASGRYTRCAPPRPLRVSRAELTASHSGAVCAEHSSWGWDDAGVWVDRGCRGSFVLYGAPVADGPPAASPPGSGGVASEVIRCETQRETDYRYCPASSEVLAARLQTRFSRATCDEGRDWGWDDAGVWVANGCQAAFAINDPRDLPVRPYPPAPPRPSPPYPSPLPRDAGVDPAFMAGSELWAERGFDDRDRAVALCARRVMQAAWRDADFSAQYDGFPTVEPWWGDSLGPSFRPDAGEFGAPGWRVSGAIVVHNRRGFERWSTTCVVEREAVTGFDAMPLGRR